MTAQPWYAAYARSAGLTPDEIQARDRQTHPLCPSIPYGSWIRAQWAEYRAEHGVTLPVTDAVSAAFGTWLEARWP